MLHEVRDLKQAPGELSFEARIGDRSQRVWIRTDPAITPAAEAALAVCLMPAMRLGGRLSLPAPVSPRLLRTQREFQAIQRSWSREWPFPEVLQGVEVDAEVAVPEPPAEPGRVAAFFSGGVDSWATVLTNPDLTDLVFVRGFDLRPGVEEQRELSDEVEDRLREAAAAIGLPLHVVDTNLRELSDPLVVWDVYHASAVAAVALALSPLFERVLIATDSDHETQVKYGPAFGVDGLLSTERLEIADDGGGRSRPARLELIATHPAVQDSLRVCWQNPDGAYNCGHCRKCLLTLAALEALGVREGVKTFPPGLDLEAIGEIDITVMLHLGMWEDVLDAARAGGRDDIERTIEPVLARGRRNLGLPPGFRRRAAPGPPASIRIAVVVPAFDQADFLAGAVSSALAQEIGVGVGVVIVNDGCPDPRTDRIAESFRDAHPERVEYVKQANGGVCAARNAGIARAIARWPGVGAVFPLDADNQLSPSTLALLWDRLAADPEVAWASPTLELFGAGSGEWRVPGTFLAYRQLFSNQSDTGTLISRRVFAAGLAYDEEIRKGYEDWEFFLRASLAGLRGVGAGRCGFRYRTRPDSMLQLAKERAKALEARIRDRNRDAYRPGALSRREHSDAPRFALVSCDRAEVELTAALDLEPRRPPLAGFAAGEHLPAVSLLTTSPLIARLRETGLLAGVLLRLQLELREQGVVPVAIGAGGPIVAFAVRTRALPWAQKADGRFYTERSVTLPDVGPLPLPAPDQPLEEDQRLREMVAVLREMAKARADAEAAAGTGTAAPHDLFFEHRHLDKLATTVPWAGPAAARTLLAVAGPGEELEPLAARADAALRAGEAGAAHLLLVDRELDGAAVPPPFDTVTGLGDAPGADVLVEQLQAGADLVLAPEVPGTPTRLGGSA
jgi:glycosyltransferase involved in cell wall biosynthesis